MDKPVKGIIEIGKMDGYEYWVAKCPVSNGFNGYVVFPKRPVRERGYRGILNYVPVHGGITFANKYNGGMVYGFDTAHCDSGEYPIADKEWVKSEIKVMLLGILKAVTVEVKYLRALRQKTKAKYAQQVIDVGNKPNYWNMGIGINLLSGEL